MSEANSMDCRVGPYPMGTKLFSKKHGQRVLHKPSFMKPGTKCLAKYDGPGWRPEWIPCEELQVVQPNTTNERP